MGGRRGWGDSLERELTEYFGGEYAGHAGLRSGVEPRYGSHNVCDIAPPRVVQFGWSRRDSMAAVEVSLERLAVRSLHLVAVLRERYRPRAKLEFDDFISLKSGDPAVAILTDAVLQATNARMAEECRRELETRRQERERVNREVQDRADSLRREIAQLRASGPKQQLQRAERELAAVETPIPEDDIEADVMARWNRPPTRGELVDTLRRACRAAEDPGKSREAAEHRAAGKALRKLAEAQAKADLASAQQQYAEIRQGVQRMVGAEAEARRFAESLGLETREQRAAVRAADARATRVIAEAELRFGKRGAA